MTNAVTFQMLYCAITIGWKMTENTNFSNLVDKVIRSTKIGLHQELAPDQKFVK